MIFLKRVCLSLFIFTILFTLSPSFSFPQKSLNIIYRVTGTEFKLTLQDGTVLDCTKFIPQSGAPNRFPAVIFLHGFGSSKNEMNPFAENLAKYGYYTFTFSMRGQGKSTGYSNLISRKEMNDLLEVIKYVRQERSVDSERVCLMGSSQGGILALMAVCNGADVKCIVADLASPEFASSWIENGSVKMTLYWSLNYDSSIVRYSNTVKNFKKWILSGEKSHWDSFLYYLPGERDFLNQTKNIKTPVLISDSWQDKFFNASGVIKLIDSLSSPFKIYLGAVEGHGSDTTHEEIAYHSSNIDKWIEHWLYGIPGGVMNSDKFTFASSTEPVNYNHWSFTRFSSSIWPPGGTTNLRLYFCPDKKLSRESNQNPTDTVSFLNDVRDTAISLKQAIQKEFTGTEFTTKFVKTYIYFESDELNEDLQMIGTPAVNLVYSSSAEICQYNFQIWEVKPDGKMNFVTRINYTDRFYYPHMIKQKYFYGQAHSHIFKRGSRLRIYATNLDNGPLDKFLGTNPFVLPLLKRARNYIYMNESRASYIDLPVIPK